MRISSRSIALLATVSVSAISLAAPTAAATSVSSGIGHSDASDPVSDTLVICDLDGACFFGVEASGEGLVTAVVDSVATGRIEQIGISPDADVQLEMLNYGDAEIAAVATATAGVLGFAGAYAFISNAVLQVGLGGSGDVVLDLSNDGTLQINAIAVADAGADGLADAVAGIGGGIVQQASVNIAGDAAISLVNPGDITIAASALASGTVAEAAAAVQGISQVATALSTIQSIEVGPTGTAFYELQSPVGAAAVELINEGSIGISAVAQAQATAFASASAEASGIVQAALGTSAQADIANSGELTIAALAEATGNTAVAFAAAAGFAQLAEAVEVEKILFTPIPTATTGTVTINSHVSGNTFIPVGPASLLFENSGTFAVEAVAAAQGQAVAVAGVELWGGTQDAQGTIVDATFINSGDISLAASASAAAGTVAVASAYNNGVKQYANATMILQQVAIPQPDGGMIEYDAQLPVGPATGSIVNQGSIEITAIAQALAGGGLDTGTTFAPGTVAYGNAYASGFGQFVWGTQATGSFENEGSLLVAAQVDATGVDGAAAVALAQGVRQGVNTLGATVAAYYGPGGEFLGTGYNLFYAGPATIQVVNDGTMAVVAQANAVASGGPASAAADARGFSMGGSGTITLMDIDNEGELAIAANAQASGTTGLASAIAAGFTQNFSVGVDFTIDVVNSGSIKIDALASAIQDNGATAIAAGVAIIEKGAGFEQAVLSVANSGTIEVDATAIAEGGYFAGGTAYATGVSQRASSANAQLALDNSGTIDVAAGMTAIADAQTGFAGASAFAHGYTGFATNVSLEVANSGAIQAVAAAAAVGASGWAWATAAGIAIAAVGGTTFAPALGTMSAVVTNAGTILVSASADGIVDAVDGRASTAEAVGILLAGGVAAGSIENSGIIDVSAAVASDDGSATANGIIVLNNGQASPNGDSVITITNADGTIIARESNNGGESWRRGMAIGVGQAPNAVVINLLSHGEIYGNIDIQDGDQIFVEDGATYFDGIINPECFPSDGVTEASLDDPLVEACGVGALTIRSEGNLVLADPRLTGDPTMYDGPAYVFVDEFNVDADGTITFELQPAAGGVQPVGTYPQIFADTANLAGTLVAEFAPAGGLFADTYFYDNVVDATTRRGGFDGAKCVLGGAYSGSLLLALDCIEEAGNIDLSLTRIAFNAVPGLNGNGTAVGSGLECVYDVNLTGGIADLFADLFLFTDPVNYNIALNQLAGSSYANYLQSFPSLGVHYNDLLANATNCEIPALAGSVLECRASAPIHVWGQLDYQWRKADGDNEAGSTRAKRFTGLLGVDASVGNSAIVGVSAGAVSNRTRDRQFGDKIEATGMQVGAYGVFDPGQFYVKAMTTYSWYDGDSEREINFAGLAPGATFAADLSGDPDVKMWTFGLHGGYRMGLGGNSVLTPYLNYDYVNARMKEFIEGGTSGAALHLDDNSAKHSFLTGGVKWATQMGGVVPEVNLGYRYRFGDKRTDITQAFLCQTDTCAFDVVSAGQKRGNFLAGLSVGGKMGPVDLRIGYEGEFNSDITSHSGNFKFVLPIGGRAAPPPPPPVMAPPPPVEVAPPPPAPVERGERGQ